MASKVTWELCRTESRPYSLETRCESCRAPFTKKQRVWVREEQVSWFRGEDEVTFYCLSCGSRQKAEEASDGKG